MGTGTVANLPARGRFQEIARGAKPDRLEDIFLAVGLGEHDDNDLAFKSQLMSGANPSAGRMLENIVYLHYRREGYRIHTGRVGQGEIDFVLQKGDEVKYAQVCYLLGNDRVAEREFGNLERTGDNYPKTVISMDEISPGNVRGISHIRAWEL